MKLRKLLEIQGIVEDGRKLPYDVFESFEYLSHSHGENIDILEMDLVHFIRAFKQISTRLAYSNNHRRVNKGRELVLEKIPNNDDGKQFVALLRQYLNRDGYKMRVRGQNVSEPYKKKNCGRCHTYHGQSVNKSDNLRIYFDRQTEPVKA